ncbi:mevalonate kinase isoform X1 [Vanessa tameamea]|uniref:Mevalonate kinase n=1 Tax=Vanessa tameamea TaxID=334116 RepID=A0A8B8IVW9_VANTA
MGSLFEIKVSAPGKVILHGEHSVMYGKFAIAGSLGLRSDIVLKEVQSSVGSFVNVNLPSVNLKHSLSLDHIQSYLFKISTNGQLLWKNPQTVDHESHLIKVDKCLQSINININDLNSVQYNSLRGMLYLISGIFGDTKFLNNSLDVSINSGLTVGAGTGSSASYAVCLAGALIQLLKLKSGKTDEEFEMEDKILISAWAYNCEKIMHGSPSGIDNSTCTLGSLVGFRKGEEPIIPSFQINLRILLVDTKVSRETKILAAKTMSLRQHNQNAVDCIMDACDHIATTAFKIMEKLSACNAEDSEAHYKHLSELWNMNHCLLASLGVSHPSLEDIKASATKYGLACKLTGAGGGGYAIVLIPPTTEQTIVESLNNELKIKEYKVSDTQLGGPGVRIDHIDVTNII